MTTDSTGKPVSVGDSVRCRGEVYTIVKIIPNTGSYDTATFEFDRPFHGAPEVPDETSIDKL